MVTTLIRLLSFLKLYFSNIKFGICINWMWLTFTVKHIWIKSTYGLFNYQIWNIHQLNVTLKYGIIEGNKSKLIFFQLCFGSFTKTLPILSDITAIKYHKILNNIIVSVLSSKLFMRYFFHYDCFILYIVYSILYNTPLHIVITHTK
jgi:hypothetical protein